MVCTIKAGCAIKAVLVIRSWYEIDVAQEIDEAQELTRSVTIGSSWRSPSASSSHPWGHKLERVLQLHGQEVLFNCRKKGVMKTYFKRWMTTWPGCMMLNTAFWIHIFLMKLTVEKRFTCWEIACLVPYSNNWSINNVGHQRSLQPTVWRNTKC